jgi:hypothetical protein
MKALYLLPITLAALLLTQCNKQDAAPAAAAGPSVPVISEGASPHFQKVASQLEVGGASFIYNEEGATMELIASFAQGALDSMPPAERAKIPESVTVRRVISLLGLDSLKASGTSSRTLAGGGAHTRSFAYAPQGRKGLLSLTGGPSAKLLTQEFAVQGCDLALEFPLHLKTLATESWPQVLAMLPPELKPMIEAMAEAPQPPLNKSYRELASTLDLRIAILATVMPDKPIMLPGTPMPLPGIEAAIIIDRLGWVKDVLKQMALPMLSNPGGPFEVQDNGGVITAKFRQAMGPAPMDFQPVIQLDTNADRLIIVTRPAYLVDLLSKEGKLASQPEFQEAWKGLPEQGNGAIYLSKRFLDTAVQMAKESAKEAKPSDAEAARFVLSFLEKFTRTPFALAYANTEEGILAATNSSLPSFNPGPLTTVTTVSILASLAVPAYNSVQQQGHKMKSLSNGKQVALGLRQFAAQNNGKYPASIEELATAGIITDSRLLQYTYSSHPAQPWLYDKTLTDSSPGNFILLAAPETVSIGSSEERLIVRNEGSAEFIPEDQFQRLKDYNLK